MEIEEDRLNGTPFEYLAIYCSDPLMRNMTDAQLEEDDRKYNGDGREMKFNIFVGHNVCIRFNFNLYGLDVHYTLLPIIVDESTLNAVNAVISVVTAYFKDKYTTAISEAFYKKFEHEIIDRLLEKKA